jgi:8-oxo-dGTP pyrophosphatase MutT (NUDIX family)
VTSPAPVFGTRSPDLVYRPRPGAYALVFDAAGRVALVHEEQDWYLPGGGLEPGETHEQALVREIQEECACGIRIESRFADAVEYLVTRSGRPLEAQLRYYRARFVGTPTARWLTPAEAGLCLRRRSDAWAISAASSNARDP